MASPADDFFKFAAAAIICGTIVLVAFIGLIAVPIGAAILGAYRVYIIYQQSPSVQERKARERTHQLYKEIRASTPRPLSKEHFGRAVYQQLPYEGKPEHIREAVIRAILDLYDLEEHLVDDLPPPPPMCNTIEGAKYRDFLSAYSAKAHSPHATETAMAVIVESLSGFLAYVPDEQSGTAFASVPLVHLLPDPGQAITDTITPYYQEDAADLFERVRAQLDRSLYAVSDQPYPPTGKTAPKLTFPDDYKGENIQFQYLRNTPFLPLFDASVSLNASPETRTEHHWIVAGSGHGKTQTLQYMIARDLELVEAGKASVVVMTSQGGRGKSKGLIETIVGLKCFAPGEPLHDKLLWIDPEENIEYPLALNLFDAKLDRIRQYSAADRERILNSTIEIYSFIMRALLDAPMTSRQETVFQFAVRLLFEVPNATIHTLLELMDRKLDPKFVPYIEQLDETARSFFKDFADGKYEDTKSQIRPRIFGILRYPSFDRMFKSPKNKVDFFTELQTPGKVVLINTAQSLLQATGSSLFGRFMIALLARAAEERATVDEPPTTLLYVDEVADYYDEQFPKMLSQVRKRNIGVVMAHQDLDQARKVPGLLSSLGANTSIRFAGGTSVTDAKTLAPDLHATADFILAQPKGTFAAYIRGTTPQAVPLSFPFGFMEKMERMSGEELDVLRARMRERYSSGYRRDDSRDQKPDEPPPDDQPDNGDDPNLVDI